MRTYLILDWTEIDLVDFNQTLTTSKESARKSLDGTKVLISWMGDTPDFVVNLTSKSQEYTSNEIGAIMNSTDWTSDERP